MPRSPDLQSERQGLTRWIELGAQREGLLQVFDEDAHFGGESAAGRSNRKDRHNSFERSQKADDGTFPEFCREEPCRRLGDSQMFEDTHPHLFDVTGSKDSRGHNTPCFLSGTKGPRLYGAPVDKNDGPEAIEIVRRFGCAVSREVLRSGDENDHRLRESSGDQGGVWKFT